MGTSIYLGNWSDREDMIADFNHYGKSVDVAAGYEVLLAYYGREDYEGSAFVLLRKVGELYEIAASHCSCYGLEEQWEPELTDRSALIHRLAYGQLGTEYAYGGNRANTFAAELRTLLDV